MQRRYVARQKRANCDVRRQNCVVEEMAGAMGLEPTTFGVTGQL
jgi:hypothetical protein